MSNLITTTTAAEDVAGIFAALGYGTIGTDIFVGSEPDGDQVQDNVFTVYDTTQFRPAEVNYCYEYPSVQCRLRWRAANARTGARRTQVLMNAVHGYVGSIGGINYRMIRVVNGPIPLGRDHRGRYRYTFNLEIQRCD